MQIQQALNEATSRLNQSDSSRLDAELLLAFVLNKGREFLMTWPETELNETEQQIFSELLDQRAQGHPVAYLIGKKAFWNFELKVTPDVLIPRPETELLVELALNNLDAYEQRVADLGTGSGAIALALASERPDWQIVATDKSAAALKIAKQNADNLKIQNIAFRQGDWAEALIDQQSEMYDAIISNPPYIDASDAHLSQGDVRFEPQLALIAGQDGLAGIKQIAQQAYKVLKPGALLLLEHGYQHGKPVRQILEQSEYNDVQTHKDLAGLDRVTIARTKAKSNELSL